MKACSICQVTQPLTEFWRNKNKSDGLDNLCKGCRRSSSKRYRANNSHNIDAYEKQYRKDDNYKLNQRVKKYGISTKDFHTMLSEQNHSCKICGKKEKLVVDHDHNSGTVRGLLCNGCNRGLGFFGDNPSALISAAYYLGCKEVK